MIQAAPRGLTGLWIVPATLPASMLVPLVFLILPALVCLK
jgi:hypothetical protein